MQLVFSVLAYVVVAAVVCLIASVVSERACVGSALVHALAFGFGLAKHMLVADCFFLILFALCFVGLLCEADDDDDEFYKEHYE